MDGIGGDQVTDFDHPPVREVVLAAEFSPIEQLDVRHLVGLQSKWADDYPLLREQPAIPPAGLPPLLPPFGPVHIRLWALTLGQEQIVQIQNDRLILNWRATPPQSAYPRYPGIAAEFERRWDQLLEYLREHDLPQPQPQVVEFTYVNQIARDMSPTSALTFVDDLPAGVPGSTTSTAAHYERDINDSNLTGRLVIDAVASDPASPTWSLTVSTRLTPSTADLSAVAKTAHDISKRSFLAMTTDLAKQSWGVTPHENR